MKNSFRLAFALVACLLFGNTALPQLPQNPRPASMSVWFMENGQAINASVDVGNVLWIPNNQGWNNRYTSIGNKIENADLTGISFPMTGYSNGVAYNITAAKVNAFWDDHYNVQGINPNPPGTVVTRISEPSWGMNCPAIPLD